MYWATWTSFWAPCAVSRALRLPNCVGVTTSRSGAARCGSRSCAPCPRLARAEPSPIPTCLHTNIPGARQASPPRVELSSARSWRRSRPGVSGRARRVPRDSRLAPPANPNQVFVGSLVDFQPAVIRVLERLADAPREVQIGGGHEELRFVL